MSAKIYINRHNEPTITPPPKTLCINTLHKYRYKYLLRSAFLSKKKSSKLLRLFIKTLIS